MEVLAASVQQGGHPVDDQLKANAVPIFNTKGITSSKRV
jgi:hypothetical protein